jgi:arylsulfatase A-like enzyme
LDALRALYDAEVAASDDRFGVLLRTLEARHAYRDSIIAFTSDHGEAFRERGRLGHGSHLHAETRDIPLLIKPAGESGRGRRVSGTVAQVDLLPTLLDLAGLPASAANDGTSFAAVVRGGDRVPDAARPVLAHLRFGNSPLRTSVSQGRWTLIHTIRRGQRGESLELFDRESDPQERSDLADRRPEVVAELLELLERGNAQAPEWPVGQHDPDATMVEQLEALGYAR